MDRVYPNDYPPDQVMWLKALHGHRRRNTMKRSNKNLILDRGNRYRGGRGVGGSSRLHDHFAAVLTEPLPADLRDLMAQLVALEAREEKSRQRSVESLQLVPSLLGQRW
jgi:hypothetical protein